jgi:hypothetical protein
MENGRRAKYDKHCIIEKCEARCEPICEPQRCEPSCKPKKCEKKHKKCSSSSSSSSEEPCKKNCCCKAPKVVQTYTEKCGTLSLSLIVDLITPELTDTYICPTDIGNSIIVKFTVTNLSTTCTIREPRYVYDSLTGLHKVGKCKLLPLQSDTFITQYTIPASACAAGFPGITSNSNAYININNKCGCVVLVSPPVTETVTIAT